MNCADYIERMPEFLLREMENSELYAPRIKEGFSLHETLTSPEMLAYIYGKMVSIEKRVLELAIMQMGCNPFDWSLLEKRAARTFSGAELRAGLIRLRQKGIVFTLRKSWGELIYVIPGDTFSLWQTLLMQPPLEYAEAYTAGVELTHPAKRGLAHDLFHFLAYIAKNGLPFTQKGTIHKRHLQKLQEDLAMESGDFEGLDLRYSGHDTLPASLAVIVDIALRLGLIDPNLEGMKLNPDRISRWLQQRPQVVHRTLYKLWFQIHTPSAVWMQHAAAWMERFPAGQWFDLWPVLQYLCTVNTGAAEEQDMVSDWLMREWLVPLAACGWIELGLACENSSSSCIFRWVIDVTSSDHNLDLGEETFFVQPDFEIIVPPHVGFAVRWELECMADHRQTNQVSRYQISQESFLNGLEQGRSPSEAISFLQRHAKYGLPENVSAMLQQWGAQYGKVHFEEVMLLRCRDEGTAREIASHPQLSMPITASLGNTDFIVRSDDIHELMTLLEKFGYFPKKHMESPGTTSLFPHLIPLEELISQAGAGKDKRSPPSSGFVYSRFSAHVYEMETKLPKLEEIYPNLHEVPSIWHKDYRSYHASTRREIIQQAIEWKTCLKLNKAGIEIRFNPLEVQENNSFWNVIGWESSGEVILSPEDWEEMQLILPGIND